MIALYQPLAVTTQCFIYAGLLGMCLGLYYEICQGIGLACSVSRGVQAIVDGLFWLGTLIAGFIFIVTIMGGQARWFVFAGLLGGYLIVHLTVGRLICRFVSWLLCTCVRSIRFLVKLCLQTYTKIINLWIGCQKILKKIWKKTSNSGKKTL